MSSVWVSAPERVSVSSTSRVPPLIVIVERQACLSHPNFMEPAVTVIPPDKVMPEAMETGVVWPTVRLLTVELASTSRPEAGQ